MRTTPPVRVSTIFFTAAWLFTACAPIGTPDNAAAGRAVVSGSAPAPQKFAGVAPAMQAFVDQGQIAGAVTLVGDRNGTLNVTAVGLSDIAAGRKMEATDLFWIASMTKPMTATCLAMLKDEGKLSFDDPVGKYLPEFKEIKGPDGVNPPARPITLRDLLSHTSGLGDYKVTDPHWTLDQISRDAANRKLNTQPGTKWSYSTTGLNILGRVVEVVSGMPFAEFMQKRLFDPLGMRDTTFWPTEAQVAHLATSYTMNRQTGQLAPTAISYMYGAAITDRSRPPLGGAGLFSTASDVLKFYQMLLNKGTFGGKIILKPETVAEMTTPQTGDLPNAGWVPGSAWGLGLGLVTQPQGITAMLAPGSFGHGGAYGTQVWADPVRGVVYILMMQRAGLPNSDGSPMRQAFQEAAAAAVGQ